MNCESGLNDKKNAAHRGERPAMPDTEFTFQSGPFRLAAALHVPDDLAPGERRPAFVILHGFGGSMKSSSLAPVATLLDDLGYVTVRFDRRGCGRSDG
jgi:alpha/beta superfamily hydrolase